MGWGGLRQIYTPLYPLFLEGNYKRLKFLNIKLGHLRDNSNKTIPPLMGGNKGG